MKPLLCLLLSVVLVLGLASCALRHSPNVTPTTSWELNTAAELQTLQQQYLTFFKDTGDAQRAGQLTPAQVQELNAVGEKLRTGLQDANRVFRNWQATRDEPTRLQVITLLTNAEGIMLELTAKKTQFSTQTAGAPAGSKP